MRWLTEAELRARWAPERLERLAERGSPEATSAAVAQAIASAEAAAEEVLLERYGPGVLPAEPSAAPAGLKDVVADMVPLRLAQAGGFDHAGDDLVEAHERALGRLRAIARGQADLGLAGRPEVDRGQQALLGSRPEPRTLSRETLGSW